MSNLENLFKPFIASDAKKYWTSFTSPRMEYYSMEPGMSFGAGFLVASKIGFMDIPHIHDGSDNYFIFTGADLDNIWDSEFQVDIFIGDTAESMEVYSITTPTFVRVPAGVWHCPVYYKKVVRGLNSMLWYGGVSHGRVYPRVDEDGNPDIYYEKDNWVHPCVEDPENRLCTYCGKCFDQTEQQINDLVEPLYKNQSTAGKYKDCVMELKKDFHKLGDAVMSPRAVFKGIEDMPETDRQFSFNIVTKPCKLGDDEPVSNGQITEYLWFSGTDVVDAYGCFDAEIEVMVGEDPDNMQALTFDRPGIVVIPAGMWRGAVTIKKVGKPVCFIPWYPHNDKRYKITQKVVDGKKLRVYDDEVSIAEPSAGDELYMQIKR
ncbi:MAG: hypothetical protein FWH33_01840 [Oscillospiraceae bacterium]|nr:hypothetical protein [Oscillospiraceae bacterium]